MRRTAVFAFVLGCGESIAPPADASTGGETTPPVTTTTSTGEPGTSTSSSTAAGSSSEDSSTGPSGPVSVQLLAINDFHGHLEPPEGGSGVVFDGATDVNAGGAIHLAGHVAALREDNRNTLVVSAGDLVGASPLPSGILHDEPTVELMNRIGLDLNAVGNHEFDDGVPELLRLQNGGCHPEGCGAFDPFEGADFRFLAANVTDEATGDTIFPAVEIVDVGGGARIAFIGMTLRGTPTIVSPSATEGFAFHNEVETVEALVPDLIADGVEAIVVLIHEGGFQSGLYDGCDGLSGPIFGIAADLPPEVDIVITGHTHQAYVCIVGGRLVTSAGSFGRIVTDIDLVIDPESGHFVTGEARNVIVTRDLSDADVGEFIDGIVDFVAPLADQEVGTAADALTRAQGPNFQSTLGAVVADAHQEAAGADIAFMNGGGLRDDIAAGSVTFGELYGVSPFGNTLLVKTFTGAQIEALLEQQFEAGQVLLVSSSLRYSFSASAPDGSRVDPGSIEVDGVLLAPDDTVRVAVNDFIGSGANNLTVFTEGTDVTGGPVDVDALADYFANNSPVSAPALDRVTVVP